MVLSTPISGMSQDRGTGMKTVANTLNAFSKRAVSLRWRTVVASAVLGSSFLFGSTASATGSAFIAGVSASPPPRAQHSYAASIPGPALIRRPYRCPAVRNCDWSNRSTIGSIGPRAKSQISCNTKRESSGHCQRRWGRLRRLRPFEETRFDSAGIDPRKLLLATVLDNRKNPHAVLVYRSSQGDLVLDNLTNRIKPWNATRYLFLRMQDPKQPRNWVGVYGRS